MRKMGIKKLTKRNAIVGLVALTLLCFIVGFLILHYLFPQNYFKLYPLIPIYFFLLTLLEIEILSKYKEKEFVTMTNKFMQLKAIKLFISLMVLLLYCFVVAEQTFAFLITFFLFYIIYLIVETMRSCMSPISVARVG
jgi:hypothetical protein